MDAPLPVDVPAAAAAPTPAPTPAAVPAPTNFPALPFRDESSPPLEVAAAVVADAELDVVDLADVVALVGVGAFPQPAADGPLNAQVVLAASPSAEID